MGETGRRVRRIGVGTSVVGALLALGVQGCGQKGPLFLDGTAGVPTGEIGASAPVARAPLPPPPVRP